MAIPTSKSTLKELKKARIKPHDDPVVIGAGDLSTWSIITGSTATFSWSGDQIQSSDFKASRIHTVSYTHLTLPTSDLV